MTQFDLQIETVSTIRRRLHFTIAQGTIKGELDGAYRKLKQQARLPGFRKGKVPRKILESRFGRKVRSDVSSKLIEDSYRDAISDLDVAGQPALEKQDKLTASAPFSFTIAVDVRPQLELTDYTGVQVPFKTSTVTDEEVRAELKRLLASKARIEEVAEERPVQEGDFVLAEVKLVKGDEELVNEAGTMVNTGAERYYPGIESVLYGLKAGEEGAGTVTIGEGSIFEHLRGQEVEATVKVINIQAYTEPEMSDELAEEMGYEGGEAGMQAAVRMRLQSARDDAARNQARIDLLQALVEANDFEVPSGMVDEQLQALVEELRVRRAYSGQDPRSIKCSEAELVDLRSRATFAAKASCILAAVARQEGLEVTDEDITAKITEIADMRGQAVEAIRGYLEREAAFGVLNDRISEEKTLEWLLEHAELQEVQEEAPVEPEEIPSAEADDEAAAGEE